MLIGDASPTIELAKKSIEQGSSGNAGASGLYLDTLGINEEEKQGVLELFSGKRSAVDPAVSFLIGATNGVAYKHLIGKLHAYPIPDIGLPPGEGRTLLDIGCNWGRWCIAAAKKGYRPLGLDPSLGAVMAARRVSQQLGVTSRYVVGDARYLPLRASSIDCVFSYSVLQHFSRKDAGQAVSEIGRVLAPMGTSLIQMPTRLGLRCLFHQARRGFRDGQGFEVRYWSLPALKKLFRSAIGPTAFSVDCFFGIGLQYSDRHLLPVPLKVAVSVSELLRHLSRSLPVLTWVADSVYVSSIKAQAPTNLNRD